MPLLQSAVRLARRVVPRGWAPLLQAAARVSPALRWYPARLADGRTLVVDLRQRTCVGHFFNAGQPYGTGLEPLLRRALAAGSVFVDVGASIGYFSQLAGDLVGRRGRVHAFEPLPSARAVLAANTAARGNVEVHPCAVGGERGEVDFYARRIGDLSSLDPAGGGEPLRVPITTLDAELGGLDRLDVLKVDVEGFELEVLRGARELIARHTPVVFFEYVERFAAPRGRSLDDFRALLEPLGYTLYWATPCCDGPPAESGFASQDVVALTPAWAARLRPP